MSLTTLAQALVSGAITGCFYALMALPLSLILGVTRALNVAHGELVLLGGYVGYGLWAISGFSPMLALPISAILLLPVGLLWLWLIQKLREPRELPSLVLTFGLALFLQTALRGAFTGNYRLITTATTEGSVQVSGVSLGSGRLLVGAVALAVVAGLHVCLTRSRWGNALRAVSLDRETAALLGINVDRMTGAIFLIAAALAGFSGVLFATLHYIHPAAGVELTLLAIVLTIWGGVGRLLGVLLAGVLFGMAEALTVTWSGPSWRELVVALILLGSIVARPTGLLRGHIH